MKADEQLSPLDASFLYLERPTEPLHVGAVAVLDGAPAFAELVTVLGTRLGALRHYRQMPVRPALDLGLPRWHDDPAFDPRRHLFRTTIAAPGDDTALHTAIDAIFSRPLATDRPLWECHLLEGLAGGRAALVTKVHHCMIDGVSGAQILAVMTDDADGNGAALPAPAEPSPPSVESGIVAATVGALASVGDMLAAAQPAELLGRAQDTLAAAGAVAGLASQRLQPFSFNGPLSGARRTVWASFDLDRFLAIRGAAACKMNDVVLAVIAGALRRFLPPAVATSGRRARALIPVNVRRSDEHLALGNRVSGMFASLPIDVADPIERLQIIATEMRRHKEQGQARAFDLALTAVGALPTPLAPFAVRLTGWWPLVHTVCTNVPGPREPRHILGRRLLEIHPVVPLAAGIGLGFAILSYAGTLSIAVTADPTLVPDVERLIPALHAAADELALRLGVTTPAAMPAGRGRAPSIDDLMERDVVTIGSRELLVTAWDTMRTRRIRHLPVVDRNRRLLGILTHRDLLAATPSALAHDSEKDRVRLLGWAEAGDVMETHVSTAISGESAAEAGRRMVRHKIGSLPVVDRDGTLAGIVTAEDFLRWATDHMESPAV